MDFSSKTYDHEGIFAWDFLYYLYTCISLRSYTVFYFKSTVYSLYECIITLCQQETLMFRHIFTRHRACISGSLVHSHKTVYIYKLPSWHLCLLYTDTCFLYLLEVAMLTCSIVLTVNSLFTEILPFYIY